MSDFRPIFLNRRRPTGSMIFAWIIFILLMVTLGYVWANGWRL